MKTILALTLGVTLALVASRGFAYPTLTGPTGLAVLPTADIASAGFTAAADLQKLEVGQIIPLRALISTGGAFEVGAEYELLRDNAAVNNIPLDRVMGANAKLALTRILNGRFSVGAQFRREENLIGPRTDYTQGYAVWTNDFNPDGTNFSSLSLTLGANWTEAEVNGGGKTDAIREFAGLRLTLSEDIAVLAEYQTREADLGDAKAISAVSARIMLDGNSALQVGYTNAFGFIGQPKHRLFAGVALGFGGNGD